MEKGVKVVIAGLGSRGREEYAKLARLDPGKMEIVAIADPDLQKLRMTAKEYHIPEERCFTSAEELFACTRMADAAIIATQDRQHVPQALLALEKGYDLLLEKPVSPDLQECIRLEEAARKYGRRVVVCHVLRYTPIYQKVKELLETGTIGEVVSIAATENVGWFHQAHSFVRGNWSNSDETSPMILQKCCHDMDLYLWLAGKTCESVSSYGSMCHFKKDNAPEGSTDRCLDGCQARRECPFDAEKIYMDNRIIGYRTGHRQWPLDVLVPEGPSEETLMEALRTGKYGRCVYRCNNNVVDHQVVNLNMTDGTTMSFTMSGFTSSVSRHAKFMGTRGELTVNMDSQEPEKGEICIRRFDAEVTEIKVDVMGLSDDFSGHGGGDRRMVEEFLELVSGKKEESGHITSLERSLESHYCALAAEQSRLRAGKPVVLKEFVKALQEAYASPSGMTGTAS
ncbi:Gfo/Idh/MocA family oxidoreductase [Clostridiaceae bacterium 68-1-5]|uniref:Gfo/Idh/MocA family oxidoreductase n=1 Tax=Suipraeoptans intestinalis TaxID=2606628 RepID=A0A6N7US80_9FIRM|nr:Gfo/Idh/MocA family oxidoreductase [Suipraeoptans intestinalis]MSR93691.1 Gfo/Idh/MocA family oxidoreductase [Suipraeoptans intestinalis]